MTTTQDNWLEDELNLLVDIVHPSDDGCSQYDSSDEQIETEADAVAEAIAKINSHTLSEALFLIEQQDPSAGRKTGEVYWGNRLRRAFKDKYSREENVDE